MDLRKNIEKISVECIFLWWLQLSLHISMLFKDVLILQPVEIRRKNLFQHFIFDCWYWQNYIDVFAYWSSRKAITKSTCDLTDELGEFRRAYDVWFEPFVSGEHVWQCFVKSWTCLSQKGHTFKLDRVSTCSSIFSHLPTCARYLSLSINSSHKPHFSLSFLKKDQDIVWLTNNENISTRSIK